MDGDEEHERMDLTSVVDAASPREQGVTGVEAEESGDGDPVARAIESGQRREAIVLCVREHGAALARLCMALVGVRAEADELAQETLLTAHASLDAWRGEGSVRAWLFGIARKQCARHVEKQRRQTAKLRLVTPGEAPSAEELVQFRQRADQARAALERATDGA